MTMPPPLHFKKSATMKSIRKTLEDLSFHVPQRFALSVFLLGVLGDGLIFSKVAGDTIKLGPRALIAADSDPDSFFLIITFLFTVPVLYFLAMDCTFQNNAAKEWRSREWWQRKWIDIREERKIVYCERDLFVCATAKICGVGFLSTTRAKFPALRHLLIPIVTWAFHVGVIYLGGKSLAWASTYAPSLCRVLSHWNFFTAFTMYATGWLVIVVLLILPFHSLFDDINPEKAFGSAVAYESSQTACVLVWGFILLLSAPDFIRAMLMSVGGM